MKRPKLIHDCEVGDWAHAECFDEEFRDKVFLAVDKFLGPEDAFVSMDAPDQGIPETSLTTHQRLLFQAFLYEQNGMKLKGYRRIE